MQRLNDDKKNIYAQVNKEIEGIEMSNHHDKIIIKPKHAPKHRRNQTIYTHSHDNSLENNRIKTKHKKKEKKQPEVDLDLKYPERMTEKVLDTLFKHKPQIQPNYPKVQYVDDFSEDINSLASKVELEYEREKMRKYICE